MGQRVLYSDRYQSIRVGVHHVKTDLEMYRLPVGLSTGITIDLPKTKISFKVILPALSNEEFQNKLLAELNSYTSKDDAGLHVNTGQFQSARKHLFFTECVLEAYNLPDGMDKEAFFAAYQLAARYIFEQANKMSVKMDEEINAALEKL